MEVGHILKIMDIVLKYKRQFHKLGNLLEIGHIFKIFGRCLQKIAENKLAA